MKRVVFVIFLFLPGILFLRAYAEDDRVEIVGGAVLTGHIEFYSENTIQLRTDYAGTLSIDGAKVTEVELGVNRDLGLPGKWAAGQNPPDRPPPAQAGSGKTESVPPDGLLNGWELETGLNLSGKSGNSDKFDLRVHANAELERQFDRINFYGKYAFGTNRGRRSADEVILGARYTNFFLDQTGFFFRQEGEHDEFEGIYIRSTSAVGLTYQFRNDKDLRIEARAGFSYRYEDYTDDGTDDFPGMDLGLDLNWRFVKWAHFKGSYTFVPSIENPKDYILEQDSGVNMPLDKGEFWKLRLGVSSQYNNQPDFNREKMDTHYYARLIATWQ